MFSLVTSGFALGISLIESKCIDSFLKETIHIIDIHVVGLIVIE
jgi:hypothetical protein